jgi:CRP-like cAMP-binding protein
VKRVLRLQGRHLREIQARCRESATERVERRIARAVLRLTRQAGRRVEQGVRTEFPISRQDIAEITGTTLCTVSRTLSGWEKIWTRCVGARAGRDSQAARAGERCRGPRREVA